MRQQLEDFGRKALAADTDKEYRKKGALWSEYIQFFFGLSDRSTVLLLDLPADQRPEVWAYFIWWLRAVKGGTHGGVVKTLGAVRHLLGIEIGAENSFTQDGHPKVASYLKASANKTRVELMVELAKKVGRQKLPSFDGLTLGIMKECWVNREWSNDDIAKRSVWVAVLMMEMFGFRPSNVLRRSADKKDHTLQFRDLRFFCWGGSQSPVAVLSGSSLRLRDHLYEDITGLEFRVLSTKNRWFKPTTLTCNKVDERGRNAIRTLLVWCQRYGANNEEGYITSYSRPALNRKGCPMMSRCTTAEEVNAAIKDAAEILGLPRSMYSSKSFRIGLATNDEITGVPVEETMKTGGWNQAKTVAGHYRKGHKIYGAKKAGRKHGLTLAEVAAIPDVQRAMGMLVSPGQGGSLHPPSSSVPVRQSPRLQEPTLELPAPTGPSSKGTTKRGRIAPSVAPEGHHWDIHGHNDDGGFGNGRRLRTPSKRRKAERLSV